MQQPWQNMKQKLCEYNPQNGQESFKLGPLRYIINRILSETATCARQQGRSDLIAHLPPNVQDKLSYIDDNSISALPNSDLKIIGDHYKFFLWLYHQAQFLYRSKVTESHFDVVEAKRRLADLLQND